MDCLIVNFCSLIK